MHMNTKARLIDSETAYQFLTEQRLPETGAFAKGVNKGLNIARSALRNPDAIHTAYFSHTNGPLTSEQLRVLDGQPVWIEDRLDPSNNGWTVWEAHFNDMLDSEYGVTWMAYAYPPARIDREQVEKVWRGEWRPTEYPYMNECEDCSVCGYRAAWGHGFRFCPNCGAPMTDKAVQMVMERLEALKDGKDRSI